jgi:hypothetical protein
MLPMNLGRYVPVFFAIASRPREDIDRSLTGQCQLPPI